MKLAISEICEKFQSGKNILASNIFDDGMYPVFGGNGLRGYTNTFNQDGEYAIIGRQGAYCGNVKYHKGKAYLTEHAIIALPKSTHNALYLAYKLKFANLAQYQGQSAQPGLSVSTLSKIKLDMPDYSKQKKIADVLSCIDDKIALNNKTNTELENMAKTIYDYWFTQFDFPDKNGHPYKTSGGQMVYNEILKREIPAGWEVGNIFKVAKLLSGGTPSKKKAEYWNGEIPFFGPTDYQNTMFQFSTAETITDDGLNNCSSYLMKKNTIIITARGSVGKLVIVGKPMAMNQSCYAFESLNDNHEYLYFLTKQLIENLKIKSSGSVFKSIISADIENSDLIIGDNKTISEYTNFARDVFLQIQKNQEENNELTKLRDYLLPLLMNGQIEVK